MPGSAKRDRKSGTAPRSLEEVGDRGEIGECEIYVILWRDVAVGVMDIHNTCREGISIGVVGKELRLELWCGATTTFAGARIEIEGGIIIVRIVVLFGSR